MLPALPWGAKSTWLSILYDRASTVRPLPSSAAMRRGLGGATAISRQITFGCSETTDAEYVSLSRSTEILTCSHCRVGRLAPDRNQVPDREKQSPPLPPTPFT